MPQLYPQPVSSNQGVTVRAGAGLYGGGPVALGQSTTLSTESLRQQYPTSPAANGSIGTFTILGPVPTGYVDVFVAGQLQNVSTYTLNGSQIFFNTPPANGAAVVAVYSNPDTRQQYTLTPAANGTVTSFGFPSELPNAAYVDVYDANGNIQYAGTDYTLNCISGTWTVNFSVAPANGATPYAVFRSDAFDDRNQYSLSPVTDGTTTRFRIVGGTPEGSIDVFANRLLQTSAAAVLNLAAGEWVVDFTTAPASGVTLLAVF